MRPVSLVWVVLVAIVALVVDNLLVACGLPSGFRGLFSAIIALAGGVYAVTGFQREDPPRGPWLLLTSAFASMVVVVSLAFWPNAVDLGLDHWLLVVSNLAYAVSILWMGRVVGDSELTGGWTARARVTMGACAVFAVGTAVFSLVSNLGGPLPQGSKGWSMLAAQIASVACDAVVFLGAANLVRLMLPLRGGVLAQSYFLLALGAGTFLVMDLAVNFVAVESFTQMDTLGEVIAVAWALLALAGYIQGRLLRR